MVALHEYTFFVGGNRSTRRKPTTFGRTLTILFSQEDWVRVHIKMNLTGDRGLEVKGKWSDRSLTMENIEKYFNGNIASS